MNIISSIEVIPKRKNDPTIDNIELDNITLLYGENNSGKTEIIECIRKIANISHISYKRNANNKKFLSVYQFKTTIKDTETNKTKHTDNLFQELVKPRSLLLEPLDFIAIYKSIAIYIPSKRSKLQSKIVDLPINKYSNTYLNANGSNLIQVIYNYQNNPEFSNAIKDVLKCINITNYYINYDTKTKSYIQYISVVDKQNIRINKYYKTNIISKSIESILYLLTILFINKDKIVIIDDIHHNISTLPLIKIIETIAKSINNKQIIISTSNIEVKNYFSNNQYSNVSLYCVERNSEKYNHICITKIAKE